MTQRSTIRQAAIILLALASVGVFLLTSGRAEGCLISATGTAETIAGGQYDGWYKYTYTVTWDLSRGLSHWDLIMKPGCAMPDHLFAFAPATGEPYDGLSTGETWAPGGPVVYTVPFEGFFEMRDPSTGAAGPMIKWEPIEVVGEPGRSGTGQFWFYSNVIPEYGVYDNVVVGKYGPSTILGDMSGAWPSCQVTPHTPEPATILFVGVGAAGLFMTWRRPRRA